jgi:tRNA G18 (ribose-2'-O)-methylase SpoU
MRAVCKRIIAIKQFGLTGSINVGVASGIIMYE